jgi:hypothetical protein
MLVFYFSHFVLCIDAKAPPTLLKTRRAGALRRARLLPVFAPCVLMRSANSAIICLIVLFRVLL